MPVQLMENVGVADHENIGANFLKDKGFSERICTLVKSHVQAKRFLTYKYPEYYQKLSEASKQTLEHQGGVMGSNEAQAFEGDPMHSLYIKFREWDDRAKEVNVPVGSLEKFKAMTFEHLMKQ